MRCRRTVFTNTKSREVELYAVNFPVICSPLPSRVNIADYVHLKGLELAENFDNTESIDVLIGSDYYWDFVSGDLTRVRLQSTANLDGCCPDQYTINHPTALCPPT